MAGLRNIVWPEINQQNAERIREALKLPEIERGPQAWRSKVIAAALADWAKEIEVNPNALDRETVFAYSNFYADQVYVKRPWGQDKPPVFNASFKPEAESRMESIGHELERLGMANARSKSGFNRAAIVMIALEKYAKKFELTAGMDAADGQA